MATLSAFTRARFYKRRGIVKQHFFFLLIRTRVGFFLSIVFPGEQVATEEEFAPSGGTFAEAGKVFSAEVGEPVLDAKAHQARLQPKTRVPVLQHAGTVTFGLVANATDKVALVDLIAVKEQGFRQALTGISAILRVSNVKRGFVESLRDEVRSGDILRVKIIEVSPHTVQLSIVDANLGVVKAFCSVCRSPLKALPVGPRGPPGLVCENCGSKETRKAASDYDSVKL